MSTKPTSLGQWLSAKYFETPVSLDGVNLSDFQNSIFDLPYFNDLQNSLGYKFKNPQNLFLAMTHASFIKQSPKSWDLKNNERLEFLGDAVLGAIVSEYIFQNCPDAKEGKCSLLRGSLVNEHSLSEFAQFLHLGSCLILSKGEIAGHGERKPSILADGLEALVAAVFVDSNFTQTKAVVLQLFSKFERYKGQDLLDFSRLKDFDPKTKLQEKTMALYRTLPRYESEQHSEQFTVKLFIEDKLVGTEIDISKKRAQKTLAQKTLDNKSYLIKEKDNASVATPE